MDYIIYIFVSLLTAAIIWGIIVLANIFSYKVQMKLMKLNNQNEIEWYRIKKTKKRQDEKIKHKKEALEKITGILVEIQTENTLIEKYMMGKSGKSEKDKLYVNINKKLDELELKGQLQIIMYVPALSDSFKEMRNYRNCVWEDCVWEGQFEQRYQNGIRKHVENISKINTLCGKMLLEIQQEAKGIALNSNYEARV